MKKIEPLCTIGENLCMENRSFPQKKLKIELPCNLAIPLLGILSEENENANSKGYMHPHVHCHNIYDSPDMEATCVHWRING